ncbi:hypothetical protein [Mycobacteroides franklinii]|uniref:hypothetical protein n=1 Tax=Mycobacteroides franklinii TaxID=948102 RepID=UPI00099459CA|nr:hypothetical protein [Mycobacteroides franklinii]
MERDSYDANGTPRLGRTADQHMWEVYGGIYTARAQAFRDETGRALALITVREGDHVMNRRSEAGAFRDRAWKDFFPHDGEPPALIFNVRNPALRFEGNTNIGTVDFYPGSDVCLGIHDTDLADMELLNRLGAEWDEGSGFVPYVPPTPTRVLVLRRIPVSELPASRIFRDMTRHLAGDWGRASAIAIQAQRREGIPEDLPEDVADAAHCLFYDPMGLIRDPNGAVRWMNGQHRAEAMRRQGVEETLVQEKRRIDAPPYPGEIREIMRL